MHDFLQSGVCIQTSAKSWSRPRDLAKPATLHRKFAVPHRGAGVLNQSENPCRAGRACLSLPLRRALRGPSFRKVAGLLASFFGFFSVFLVIENLVKKRTVQKSTFFRKFGRFRCLRRRFEAILGPKTGLRKVLRTCFSALFSRRSFASILRRFLG